MGPSRPTSMLSRSASGKMRSSKHRDAGYSSSLLLVLVILVVGIPAGSYFMLHSQLTNRFTDLQGSFASETQEVERLRKEVGELNEIKEALSQAVTMLQQLNETAVKSASTNNARSHVPSTVSQYGAPLRGGGTGADRPKCDHGKSWLAGAPPDTFGLFKDLKQPGVYVDIGAGDGMFMSKTHYLDVAKCWKGIVVEPSPVEFPKLKDNRPSALAINAAICDRAGQADFADITESGKWTGWSGFEESWGPKHRAQIDNAVRSNTNVAKQIIQVKCTRLDDVLTDAEGLGKIDLITVAVEGHEIPVLRSIDLTKWHVNVIQVEADPAEIGIQNELEQLLIPQGYQKPYRMWNDHKDLIFLRNGFSRNA